MAHFLRYDNKEGEVLINLDSIREVWKQEVGSLKGKSFYLNLLQDDGTVRKLEYDTFRNMDIDFNTISGCYPIN